MAKKKPKIVLFCPKPAEDFHYGGMPLPLLGISSMIDRKKFDIVIIKETDDSNVDQRVLENIDGAICFATSVMTGYPIKRSIKLIKKIRGKTPVLPIVWGGYHPTILPKETIQSRYVDIIVIGQGERTFSELVDAIYYKKPLDKVKGIAFKKNGKIIFNDPRPVEDMNNFPPIPIDLIDKEKCIIRDRYGKATNYITSMGCPFNCAFCVEPIVYKRRWICLDADNAVKGIEKIVKEFNVDYIILNDNNFFVSEERVRKICQKLIEKGIKVKLRQVNGRVDQLLAFKDSTWRLMKKSGFRSILIGAESGMQEGLDLVNKRTKVEQNYELIKKARKFGIEIVVSLMIGLPFENYTQKTFSKELNSIFDLLDSSYPVKDYQNIYLFIYTPYPCNPLFEKSKENGFKPPTTLEGWADFELVNINIPWLKKNNFETVDYLMNFIFPYARKGYGKGYKSLFYPVKVFLHKIAEIRWNSRYFNFPIEYKLLKFLGKSK